MITFVNSNPSYLTRGNFDSWHNSFNSFVNISFGKNRFYEDVYIEFSDLEKIKKCGTKTIQDIIDELKKTVKLPRKATSKLKKINSYGDFRVNGEEIYSEIRNSNPNFDYDYNDFCDLFRSLKYEYRVLGEYELYSTIILYTKNIEKHANENGITLLEAFEHVFVHELFHMYHYENEKCPDELTQRLDYTSTIVKESLASYFEYSYCVHRAFSIAASISNSWYLNPVTSYPYSGAQFIHDKKKFNAIYNESLTDMDAALRMLLYSRDFYDIKNLVRVKEIEKKIVADTILKLNPNDVDIFKKQLLLSKKAEIKLEYADGTKKTRIWNANKMTATTDILRNIRTSSYWRNRKKTGLALVEITVL